MLIENLPESSSLPKLLCRAPAQRNDPTADTNRMLWAFHSGSGKIQLHGLRITVNEIEYAVATGVHAGNQVRPGHRTLRRDARRELPKRSLLQQLREVRHFPFPHELLEQMWIHAVNAENDEFVV